MSSIRGLSLARSAAIAFASCVLACFPISSAATSAARKLRIAEETIWTQKDTSPYPFHYAVTVKAVLPDGSHALLNCERPTSNCNEVEPVAPERMPSDSRKCKEFTANALIDRTCVISGLGTYRFKRKANTVTVYGPVGKVRFAMTGSW